MAPVQIPDEETLSKGDRAYYSLQPVHSQVGVEPPIVREGHLDISSSKKQLVLAGPSFPFKNYEGKSLSAIVRESRLT